jgi:hypothetical protein
MKTLPELIEELQAVDPDLPGNAAPFEALLAEVVALRMPEAIGPLLGLFRDNSQYDELMFSIIHGVEVFDDQTYVTEILRGASLLCSKSPRWASIIFMRMLNSEPTRLALVRQLRDAEPAVKATVKSLVEKINAHSVQFLPKTTAVLVAAS